MQEDKNKLSESKIIESINKIRPSLQADGGDVVFKEWDEKNGIVKVSMTGMCMGCPMSAITLKEGIEKEVKKAVPEVKEVINV